MPSRLSGAVTYIGILFLLGSVAAKMVEATELVNLFGKIAICIFVLDWFLGGYIFRLRK